MSAIHPALSDAFPPSFAGFGRTLGPPCADATPLPDLLAVSRLPVIAARYAASFPGAGTQAALSLWSHYYLLALVPCATAAALSVQRELPLALGGMSAVLSDAGHPCRLCLPHDGRDSAEGCPIRRLAPLLVEHLVPLCEALAATGLSKLIFWSNAAAVLAWSLDVVSGPEDERRAVRASMSSIEWVDGVSNPFRAVIGNDPSERRICCLRFRLQQACPGCPKSAECKARNAGSSLAS